MSYLVFALALLVTLFLIALLVLLIWGDAVLLPGGELLLLALFLISVGSWFGFAMMVTG